MHRVKKALVPFVNPDKQDHKEKYQPTDRTGSRMKRNATVNKDRDQEDRALFRQEKAPALLAEILDQARSLNLRDISTSLNSTSPVIVVEHEDSSAGEYIEFTLSYDSEPYEFKYAQSLLAEVIITRNQRKERFARFEAMMKAMSHEDRKIFAEFSQYINELV